MLRAVLITGSSGLVGNILWQGLSGSFELHGLDQRAVNGRPNTFMADITQPEAVDAVFDSLPALEYVVHLAGEPHVDANWDSVYRANIGGTANIYASAHWHGIKRLVFASSNHATGAFEGFPPSMHLQPKPALLSAREPVRPDGFYGVSKAAGEAIARMYFERYGLESVCLRIGSVTAADDPTENARLQSTWLSHRDLVQLVRRSLSAESVGYGIYYGVSNNRKRFWDITDAERDLGYHPQDDASNHTGA